MKIGTMFQLEVMQSKKKGSDKANQYRCKLIDKNEQYIFIDFPVNIKSKKTAVFAKGTVFEVTFVGDDEVIYKFRSKLITKIKGKIPSLAIQKPDNVHRIQRRNFIRVETAVDVAVHSDQNLFPPFITVTNDVGAGGLSLIVPKNQSILGEIAELWLVLPMSKGAFLYPNIRAKLVHQKKENNKITIASFQFLTLDTKMEQFLIRFCFEKQREARKKQLFDQSYGIIKK
ncbi:flagellar brake protein [Virgibacillus sp.]|uniref:flagellar brake protein n=1 Tax=Virgibacillus sp. TaxID=1872700 RepID=UPI0018403859|nr:flagellar brake domain-containing protein [Virgibacillus sp.]NWO12281.1 flagellar brake domain-containing protein [Virgibacillus sp.]